MMKRRLPGEMRKKGLAAALYPKVARETLRRKRLQLQREHQCETWRIVALPLTQVPLWIMISLVLRRMSGAPSLFVASSAVCPPSPLMDTQGALWCLDLTAPDGTLVLPVLMGLFNILNLEVILFRVCVCA